MTAAAMVAQAKAEIAPALIACDTLANSTASVTLRLPALSPWLQGASLSAISAGYADESFDKAPQSAFGKGARKGFFDAETYLKTSRATITGHASYTNGKRRGIEGCEVSDPALIYPYLTADTIGGDMNTECYRFGGSYASSFGGGKWIYGAELHYRALQEYRQRDPRPKNTVGQLDFALSFGRKLDDYFVVVGGDAYKYSQSGSISFVSDLGAVKVHHLTGLGTQYNRFAGSNREVNFSGWRRGVTLAIWPSTVGAFASVGYHCLTLGKVLKSLNNLPSNRVVDNQVEAEAGWRAGAWSVSASADYNHRSGIDNIFGDPAGNVYPELFSLANYKASHISASAKGAWRHMFATGRLTLAGSLSYVGHKETYTGSAAVRQARLTWLRPGISASYAGNLGRKFILEASADARASFVPDSSLDGIGADADYFGRLYMRDFDIAAGRSVDAALAASLLYVLKGDYALGLRLSYRHTAMSQAIHGNAFGAALTFKF